MATQSRNIVERGFYNLGWAIERFWFLVLPATLGIYIFLTTGMQDARIEDDFYKHSASVQCADRARAHLFAGLLVCLFCLPSALRHTRRRVQVVKPRSRINREVNYYTNRVDEGYVSGAETTFGVATSGGKNVLARSNLKEAWKFYRDVRLTDVAIEYRGVRYSGRDVLTFQPPTPQPYRFVLMDCWQEGSFDFEGDVMDIIPAAETAVLTMDTAVAPFSEEDQGSELTVTPYNWCIYARIGLLFGAVPQMDPNLFGRCRQFLNDDILYESPEMRSLDAAYDFYRFYMYDYVLSSPSFSRSWGCRVPFDSDATNGRCSDLMSCCEVSLATAGCALCESYGDAACGASDYDMPDVMGGGAPSTDRCAVFANLISGNGTQATSFDPNDAYYNAEYDALPACSAFDFYPVSGPTADALSAVTGFPTDVAAPTSLNLSDCSQRHAHFQAAADDEVTAVVRAGVENIICDLFSSGSTTCPRTLTEQDFDWRFSQLVATDDQLIDTGFSGRCTLWDGGPEGLGIFPYIDIRLILGGRGDRRADVVSGLYPSKSPNLIGTEKRAAGNDVSDNEATEGRSLWLEKYVRTFFGRHDGGDMYFSALSSESLSTTFEKQAVPEVPILIVGYVLVLVYAILVGVLMGGKSISSKAMFGVIAFIGVLFVFLGLAAGWGLSGGFLNIKLNLSIIQVLPFLTVGLGVNDLFIVSHAYSRLLHLPGHTTEHLIADVLGEVGPAITLTTVANFSAFLIGRVLEMRLLRDFTTVAAICSATIFIALLFGFTSLLAIHAKRFRSEHLEEGESQYGEKRGGIDPGVSQNFGSRASWSYVQWLESYSQHINRPLLYAPILLASLVITLTLGLIYIPTVTEISGLEGSQLFIEGTSEFVAGAIASRKVKLEPQFLMHREFDFAHLHPYFAPLNRGDYSLVERFSAAKKADKNPESWYHVFARWGKPCSWASFDDADSATFQASDCEDDEFYNDANYFNSRCAPSDPYTGGNCGPRVSPRTFNETEHILVSKKRELYESGTSNLASSDIPVCTIWPVYMFMCDGKGCFDGYLREEDLDPMRDPPLLGYHPAYVYECLNVWLNADERWRLLNPLLLCENPEDSTKIRICEAMPSESRRIYRGKSGEGGLEFSQVQVYVDDSGADGRPWINFLNSVMRKLNDFYKETGIRGWPGNDSARFFTQFRWLENRLWLTIVYGLLIIFGILAILFYLNCSANTMPELHHRILSSIWSALITVLNILCAIVIVVAIFAASGYRFNCFSAVNILMCTGFGVEFTAHIVLVYVRKETGDNAERLTYALSQMLPPIVDGSISTLLSILPLAASKYPYVVLYFFGLYMLISVIGLYVGCLVLPACLAGFGYNKLFYDVPEHPTVKALPCEKDDEAPDEEPRIEEKDDEADSEQLGIEEKSD